jgi:hypothetical protein
VRLTTSLPSCAECHEIWETKPPGTLRDKRGLLRNSFSFLPLSLLKRKQRLKFHHSSYIPYVLYTSAKAVTLLSGMQPEYLDYLLLLFTYIVLLNEVLNHSLYIVEKYKCWPIRD